MQHHGSANLRTRQEMKDYKFTLRRTRASVLIDTIDRSIPTHPKGKNKETSTSAESDVLSTDWSAQRESRLI